MYLLSTILIYLIFLYFFMLAVNMVILYNKLTFKEKLNLYK